jgi:hypothetical protein
MQAGAGLPHLLEGDRLLALHAASFAKIYPQAEYAVR